MQSRTMSRCLRSLAVARRGGGMVLLLRRTSTRPRVSASMQTAQSSWPTRGITASARFDVAPMANWSSRRSLGAYASLETKRVGVQGAGIKDQRTAGYRDGERSLFRSPSAVLAGTSGELLVADTMNNCIRGLLPPPDGTSPWRLKTVCGQTRPGHADGNCEVALFDQPVSLCWGEDSNTFFVADRGNACIRQVGRSYGNGLSYTWVRTVEVGGVPRALRSLYQCTNPLGMVCIPCQPTEDGYIASQLVVCDGGDNVIKLLPLEELMNVKERCDTPETTAMRSTFPHSESEPRSREESVASLSPRTNYTDSEDLGEENQFGNDCGNCPCDASRALEEALRANAALQAENLRLRELLQCTFDEIELADKRFSENYQPQVDEIDETSNLSPTQQSKAALPTK